MREGEREEPALSSRVNATHCRTARVCVANANVWKAREAGTTRGCAYAPSLNLCLHRAHLPLLLRRAHRRHPLRLQTLRLPSLQLCFHLLLLLNLRHNSIVYSCICVPSNTETKRHRDKETKRHRDKETKRETQRQTHRQTRREPGDICWTG
eukprot:COSAG03_NODE_2091_length_3141_cov_70.098948_4_plen_152_part_00